MAQIARFMVVAGLGTAALGCLLWALSSLAPGLRLGRLPGDIVIDQGGAKVFIPLTTMLIVSLVATAIVWLYGVVRK